MAYQRDISTESRAEPQGALRRLADAAWQNVLLAGIASALLGVLVLAWPGATLLAVAILFGVYLLVSGVFQIAAALGTHTSTSLRVMGFISGALSVLLGLLCFRSALESVLMLALWVGIGWLFRGITLTLAAAHDPSMPARGWLVLAGIVSVLGGVVMITSPFTSLAVLTVLSGCWLLALGIVEIVTAFRIRSRAKQALPGEGPSWAPGPGGVASGPPRRTP
ncbi:HdeD family acid-resistance protein [Streptomyces sp. NPDC001691]|uniref:HdeD family acid-resistance protein n=1 Tax=unclassified Streptomyces TaxID=2593676 RepID=UPI001CB96120|nr:HdeD family acid-resistance protein [Streptomyces sp. SDr-06]